jgi:hypothetical protein|nr:MAG TPA: hypothetical protein [Caudoviricetes sp.]
MVHSCLVVMFAISLIAWIIATVYAFAKKETLPMMITLVILNVINLLITFTAK